MRGYLENLDNVQLVERIKDSTAFNEDYRFLLNDSGRLGLHRADVTVGRIFIWNYQCAVTGKPLRLVSTMLDHCHQTDLSHASMNVILASYHHHNRGLFVIYPG